MTIESILQNIDITDLDNIHSFNSITINNITFEIDMLFTLTCDVNSLQPITPNKLFIHSTYVYFYKNDLSFDLMYSQFFLYEPLSLSKKSMNYLNCKIRSYVSNYKNNFFLNMPQVSNESDMHFIIDRCNMSVIDSLSFYLKFRDDILSTFDFGVGKRYIILQGLDNNLELPGIF